MISDVIKDIRRRNYLNQTAFANKIGVTQGTVSMKKGPGYRDPGLSFCYGFKGKKGKSEPFSGSDRVHGIVPLEPADYMNRLADRKDSSAGRGTRRRKR